MLLRFPRVLVPAALALAGCGSEADRPVGPDPDPVAPTGVALVFADSALQSAVEEAAAAAEAGDAAGLVSLSAKDRGIADLDGIEQLRHLEVLDLYGNEIRDLSPLGELRRLRYLDLGSNQVEEVSPLSSLKSLQVLLLADNEVTEVSALAGLDSLQSVDLTGNPLSEAAVEAQVALRERGVTVDFTAPQAPEGSGDGGGGVILGELPIVFSSSRRTRSRFHRDLEVHSLDLKTGELVNLSDDLARAPFSDGSLPDSTAFAHRHGEDPAQSPDGKRIAFASFRDGNREIYVMGADGSGPENLTLHDAWDVNPAWSPDGERIAFVSDRNGDVEIWSGFNTDIFVMNADGSGLEQVTSDPESLSADHPAWSPGGTSIAFSKTDSEGYPEVFVQELSSGDVRLVSEGRLAWSPSWSPDGRWIACIGRGGNLWVMAVDGGEARQLTFGDEFWDEEPSWSPDGTRIVFARVANEDSGMNYDLYVIPAEGGAAELITDHPNLDMAPWWAPF